MSSTPATDPDELSSPLADDITVNQDIETSQNNCKETLKVSPPLPPPSTDTPPAKRLTTVTLAPYIIVVWNDQTETQSIWGRVGVAFMSYQQFAKKAFDVFILHPSGAPPRKCSLFKKSDRALWWKTYKYLRADFLQRAKFRPQFATPGKGLEGRGEEAFFMQPVGWQQMVVQLVSLRIEYEVPDDYPGKADLFRMCGRPPKQ